MIIKKEYTGIDIFKLFAAIGVLAIHANAPFLEILGRLGVPFFAITSAFFFFKHYLNLSRNRERQNQVVKFCKRIFLLYLTWQVMYLPLMFK
ncbi:acyltransferase family protein [Limosilactobacillus reuteri]